jgi:hypothetical protein
MPVAGVAVWEVTPGSQLLVPLGERSLDCLTSCLDFLRLHFRCLLEVIWALAVCMCEFKGGKTLDTAAFLAPAQCTAGSAGN